MIRSTTLLRPVARTWLARVQSDLSMLPVPSNAARQHVSGPDADRVLVFGNGPASGFGVRSQELALPGHLARELARITGRGVEVDLGRGRGMTIESAPQRLDHLRLARYDAVVVTLGATDAGGLLPEARWEQGVRGLLHALRERMGPEVPILWAGIRPQARTPQGVGLFDRLVDRHGGRLDAVTVDVLSDARRAAFVALEPALRSVGEDRYCSSVAYRAIAERAAAVLAPALDRRHVDGGWARTRAATAGATATASEARRQRAVEEMGVLDRPPSARLERLVRSAADLLDAAWASVAVLDGDQLVTKASSGVDGVAIPRTLTICDRTVESEGAVVVGDATADPDAAGYGMQVGGTPVRFYAGHPIETPDGYRLGTVCVFDARPRDPATVDRELLRDLALRVQNELWDEVGWSPAI